jgi:DNA-binding MarR family transcriptional regulator
MSRARPNISRLDSHLGYWLRFVSNSVSHAFQAKVAAHDVTVAEWVALRELYDHEVIAPSALAEQLGMTRGTVSKLVDRLLVKKLVQRTQGEGDRRYQELAITAAGRALVPKLAALADANDAEFFGHLGARERTTLEAALRDIVRQSGLSAHPVD